MMNNAALKGCNEIIMHKDGIITEAGASNVFFIIDNAICTPSLNNNILPGITRDMSIKILEKIILTSLKIIFLLNNFCPHQKSG